MSRARSERVRPGSLMGLSMSLSGSFWAAARRAEKESLRAARISALVLDAAGEVAAGEVAAGSPRILGMARLESAM